jgi:general secretion pathway protein K
MRKDKKSRGAALIAALMLLAIVAAIASDLISRSQIDIHRTNLILSAEQLTLNTTFALAWAQQMVLQNRNNTPTPNNDLNQATQPVLPLPLVMPTQKLDNAATTIDATLSSAQSRFNLNNLREPANIPLFAKLIQSVSDLKPEQSMAIAADVAYFIGTNKDPKIEQLYVTYRPAYLPSHQLFASPSELRLVRGITPQLYQQLEPYIIALPVPTAVDPSSSSKPVLVSYGLTEAAADVVVSYTKNNRFNTLADFYRLSTFQPSTSSTGGAANTLFDLQTNYFLLSTSLKSGQIKWTVYSILQMDKTNGKLVLIQQSRNTL